MIGFRDKTFCAAACENADCHRNVTPEVEAAAERWWGGPGAPMAMADFSGRCADYLPALDRNTVNGGLRDDV